MGIIKLFSDSTDFGPPNPDPNRFKVLRIEVCGQYQIVEVRYDGCTTFNGRKLLLMRLSEIGKSLDPHLLGNGHPVVARFEPTKIGWEMARRSAQQY